MTTPVTDRLAALSRDENAVIRRTEAARQELADLHVQISVLRKCHNDSLAAIAAARLDHERQLCVGRQKMSEREERLVQLWHLFKRRIRAERADQRAEWAARMAEIGERKQRADAACTRIEKRSVAVARTETRFRNRAKQMTRQIKQLHAIEADTDAAARQTAQLRQEIAALEVRAGRTRELCHVDRPNAAIPVEQAREAENLADLRLRLLQRLKGFLALAAEWEYDRAEAVARLVEVEQKLVDRNRAVSCAEMEISETLLLLENQRRQLEARERRVAARIAALTELYRNWSEGLRDAQSRLEAARDEADELREQWVQLRDRTVSDLLSVQRRELSLAAGEMALETYRRECLDAADRPEVAERRMQRLRRRLRQRCAADVRDLDHRLDLIFKSSQELDQREHRVAMREMLLDGREEELAEQTAALHRQVALIACSKAGQLPEPGVCEAGLGVKNEAARAA